MAAVMAVSTAKREAKARADEAGAVSVVARAVPIGGFIIVAIATNDPAVAPPAGVPAPAIVRFLDIGSGAFRYSAQAEAGAANVAAACITAASAVDLMII
jgi:hypothetical protein